MAPQPPTLQARKAWLFPCSVLSMPCLSGPPDLPARKRVRLGKSQAATSERTALMLTRALRLLAVGAALMAAGCSSKIVVCPVPAGRGGAAAGAGGRPGAAPGRAGGRD